MIAPAAQSEPRFFFLEATQGKVFCALRLPSPGREPAGCVLCVQSLGEEMNRCRAFLAQQSRALAASGIAVLSVDPFGCGDSEGEFDDALLETWVADLQLARQWLAHELGLPVDLWAVRQGALLAMEALAHDVDPAARVVLWQPVTDGRMVVEEWLRIAAAGGILGGSGLHRRVSDLRAALDAGERVDVGGYLLSPRLAAALEAVLPIPRLVPEAVVRWLEIVAEPDAEPVPARRQLLDEWRAQCPKLEVTLVAGRRFWSSVDADCSDGLIDATLEVLVRDRSRR